MVEEVTPEQKTVIPFIRSHNDGQFLTEYCRDLRQLQPGKAHIRYMNTDGEEKTVEIIARKN